MPEVNQFTWSHKELATLLLKEAGIHEGRWFLMMNFSFAGGNFGPSDDQMSPGVVVTTTSIGIQRVLPDQKTPAALTIDAAEVNPVSPKTKRSPPR
jgi:hypothetical protein